jgi:hypothetical protein
VLGEQAGAQHLCTTSDGSGTAFLDTNYAGRYVCSLSFRGNSFTAIMILMPSGSGSGTYRGGTLVASVSSLHLINRAAEGQFLFLHLGHFT